LAAKNTLSFEGVETRYAFDPSRPTPSCESRPPRIDMRLSFHSLNPRRNASSVSIRQVSWLRLILPFPSRAALRAVGPNVRQRYSCGDSTRFALASLLEVVQKVHLWSRSISRSLFDVESWTLAQFPVLM